MLGDPYKTSGMPSSYHSFAVGVQFFLEGYRAPSQSKMQGILFNTPTPDSFLEENVPWTQIGVAGPKGWRVWSEVAGFIEV